MLTAGSHVPVASRRSPSMRDGQSIVPGLFMASLDPRCPVQPWVSRGECLLYKGEGMFSQGSGGLSGMACVSFLCCIINYAYLADEIPSSMSHSS